MYSSMIFGSASSVAYTSEAEAVDESAMYWHSYLVDTGDPCITAVTDHFSQLCYLRLIFLIKAIMLIF